MSPYWVMGKIWEAGAPSRHVVLASEMVTKGEGLNGGCKYAEKQLERVGVATKGRKSYTKTCESSNITDENH
jgi:hypothetical protein